jgi:hypothetical protein
MTGWFRPSRAQRGADRYLNAKVAIFCLGAGIAVVGIATDTSWIITVAIAVLFVGFLLRFLPRNRETD